MQTDAELLRQYVEAGSEAAFTEIVRRHAGLVYAAALRWVGGHAHLAKDVTQDTFILLARKAPALVEHETLIGWLYTTTRFVALGVIRNLRRREVREQKAVAMQTNSVSDISWEQLRPLLDEAVCQLDAPDREAVLLRYFQGKSYREVGAALNLTENTARVRTERAVEKLRRRFARSGVVTTGAWLAEIISVNAAPAAPAGLVAEVAAVAHAKGLSLGHLFLKAIYMTTKTKIALAVVLILAMASLPFVIPYQSREPGPTGLGSSPKVAQFSTSAAPVQVAAPTAAPASLPTTQAKMTTPKKSMVNPRAPMPGVYPNRPTFIALMAAAQTKAGAADGTATSEAIMRLQFGNLFQKMKFTPEQVDAFIKIQLDVQDQESQLVRQNPIDAATSESLKTMTDVQASAFLEQKLEAEEQQIEFNAAPQIQQLMGSDDNYQYYQTYTDQNKERMAIVMGYPDYLTSAGAPPLTLDQEEQLVNVVYQIRLAANGSALSSDQAAQILQQAGTFLSADQVQVLQQIMPVYVVARTKWSRG